MQVLGWKILIVWQCQAKNQLELAKRLQRFLESEVT
jgi:G:T-mismatch repair DNA endonuclease (very short patch repair protein)